MDLISQIEKTVFVGISWLVSAILFLAFKPIVINLFQSIALFLASGIITIGIITLIWIAAEDGK